MYELPVAHMPEKRHVCHGRLLLAHLQTQNGQAVALPDTLEAGFDLWLKSQQVALRVHLLKPVICLDHGEQLLEQGAVIGDQAQPAAWHERQVDGVEKRGRDQPALLKFRVPVGVGKMHVHLPQPTSSSRGALLPKSCGEQSRGKRSGC